MLSEWWYLALKKYYYVKKYYYNKSLHRVIKDDLQIVLFSKLKHTNPPKTLVSIYLLKSCFPWFLLKNLEQFESSREHCPFRNLALKYYFYLNSLLAVVHDKKLPPSLKSLIWSKIRLVTTPTQKPPSQKLPSPKHSPWTPKYFFVVDSSLFKW